MYSIIEKDKRHHTIIQVLGKELKRGSFDSYETDIITEKKKYKGDLLRQYLEALKGMDPNTKQVVERILEVFIDTRS